MIGACDRLGGKLDEVAGILREQMEAWRQLREPAAPCPGAPETPAHPPGIGAAPVESSGAGADREPTGPTAWPETEPDKEAGASAGDETGAESMAAMTESARRLADTLSRSQGGWPEQAAGLQQSLEAIMAHLESQAAAAPRVDVAGIMNRLRDIEEGQKNLQGQLNNNRWGP